MSTAGQTRKRRRAPSSRRARRAPAFGTALRVAVAWGLGAIFLHTWLVAGLFRSVIVASGSMAPALRGPHRLWACTGCGREFACGLESLPSEGRSAVCPYCQRANDAGAGVDRRGSRVLVDRSAYVWRAPRRWEAVVLQYPGQQRDWCVKRIVGLPGERVEIRDGDVWIDGQVARKTVAETRQTAVLVHQARASQGAGWHDSVGGWKTTNDRFVHRAVAMADGQPEAPIHWLEYHHPARSAATAAGDEGPLLDESPYDQAESRLLNPVSDVLLACRVTCGDRGALLLRGENRGERFLVRLDLDSNEITLKRNGKVVASNRTVEIPRGPFRLDWMLADRQVQLALDGQVVIEYAYGSAGVPPDGLPSLAIGAQGSEVSLSRLEVWRDVDYTPGPARDRRKFVLGPDEYFLLGDNSPHSRDSRSWGRFGVSAGRLIGRVLRW